jgi:NAD(P)-dependent dehydrogenase (short-subunit alcohol dehydrogenase family)
MIMGLLDGKVCIVTGAGGSLGLASARRFAEEGGRVLLVDRDPGALAKAQQSVAGSAVCAADVVSARGTQAYVDAAVATFGPIDVLFSNAGVSGVVRPVTDYPEDIFDQVIAINLKGSFLACKHALPKCVTAAASS